MKSLDLLLNIPHKVYKLFHDKISIEYIVPVNDRSYENIDNNDHIIAIELTRDEFCYYLFTIIIDKILDIKNFKIDFIFNTSINGDIGNSIKTLFNRTYFVNFKRNLMWYDLYKKFNPNIAYISLNKIFCIENIYLYIWSLHYYKRLKKIYKKKKITSLKIENIETWDLLVDSYLRYKPSPSFDINDRFILKLLRQIKIDINKAEKYFTKKNVKLFIASYSVYIEHGIPIRVALKNNVKVVTFGNLQNFGKVLSQGDYFHTANCNDYKILFDSLNNQDEKLNEAEVFIEKRFSGEVDKSTIYMKKSAYLNNNLTIPHSVNDSIVIFLHDFFDSPHIYPDMIFNDFWEWICKTIEILSKSEIKFYLKSHPIQGQRGDRVLELLKLKYPDLIFLDSNISNKSLAKNGIRCGVSVYGSIAHELAYFGVPTICCARHPHNSFSFCLTAKTVDQYERFLFSPPRRDDFDDLRIEALKFIYMHNLFGSHEFHEIRSAYVNLRKFSYYELDNYCGIVEAVNNVRNSKFINGYVNELIA